MAQTAAHLVESVMPWVPTRPWVVSVAIPLRYWTAPSCDLTAPVHSIIRTTIAQFYANQAVKRGVERQKVQPGSVTFLQRFGGSLNLNLHDHVIAIEGVFSIASIRASNPVCSRVSRPAMRTWQRWSRTPSGESSARSAGWATWKPEWMFPWPLGMIRYSTPHQSLPAPWRLRSSSVSPLAHGLESKCAASARALAMQANGLHSQAPVVPVSTAFLCLPPRRFQRIGVISWSPGSRGSGRVRGFFTQAG